MSTKAPFQQRDKTAAHRTPPGQTPRAEAAKPSASSEKKQDASAPSTVAVPSEELVRLHQLASLGTRAAALGHEFNNLLTPMLSYSQFVLESNDATLMRSAVEKSRRSAERLTALCDRILNLTPGKQVEKTTLTVKTLIDDAIECLGRDLDKDKISLLLNVPEELRIEADLTVLIHVLINLLSNARQAMLKQGGEIKITAAQRTDAVEIAVADNGPGIASEDIERIFQPFFSTKKHNAEKEGGIGLGLYISRQLMNEQGGTLTVTSALGQGATFVISIPLDTSGA